MSLSLDYDDNSKSISMNEWDNDGYESTSSLESSYDDELHMAALIGKKLLDRNSELEQQLAISINENQEREKEIELLTKQISDLREAENLRALTYEQWDLARLQVERDNERLAAEKQIQYKLISSLQYNLEQLEDRCNSLDTELQEVIQNQQETKRPKSRFAISDMILRRTLSMEDFNTLSLESFNKNPTSTNCSPAKHSYYKDQMAERLSKITFERDKLSRQNAALNDMIDKCDEEIQRHLTAYEDLEKKLHDLEPKAAFHDGFEELLTMYVESASEASTESLEILRTKLHTNLGCKIQCNNNSTNSDVVNCFGKFIDLVIDATRRENCPKCCPIRKKANSKSVSCQTFPVYKKRNTSSKYLSPLARVDKSSGSSAVSTDCKTLLDNIYKCLADAKSD